MNFSEEQLGRFAASPSQTETEKMNNAETAVRKAIAASDELNNRGIRVFAQGSYRNRVNVRSESDVDIAVVCDDTLYWMGGPPGASLESLEYGPGTFDYDDFRRDVIAALRSYFASGQVHVGNKAIDVSGNTYRVEAYVVPFFQHKRFHEDGTHIVGVEMRPTSGGRIVNWPVQHYANGVAKNTATGRAFKGCVRILKALRYQMIEAGLVDSDQTSSFLIECMVYNVPNNEFRYPDWESRLRSVLAYLYNNTLNDGLCEYWVEVSDLKYLFHPTQAWTRAGAHSFVSECWDFVGYD